LILTDTTKKVLKMSNSYKALVAQLNAHKGAATPDIRALFCETSCFRFTEKTLAEGEKLGVDFEMVFDLPQKQVKRATQLVNALSSADYKSIDYTHARILCAMKLAGSYDLNTDAITALAAGVINPNANTRGIARGAVNALFAKSHGLSTVQTKVSNSTGKNGIYQALGVSFAAPGERNHTVTLNTDSPIVKRFFDLIDRATVGQLEELTGTK
jgi:hypothetical protein